jgi:hypothetical protein
MKLKLAATIPALVAAPALVLAQQGGPPPIRPKPTKADIQKVIQIITSDKAKTQAYCDLNKLYEQMDAAEQKERQRDGANTGQTGRRAVRQTRSRILQSDGRIGTNRSKFQ